MKFNTTSLLVFVLLFCLLTLFCFIVSNVSFWFDVHQQVQYNVNCFKLFHLNACINFTCLISCFFSEDLDVFLASLCTDPPPLPSGKIEGLLQFFQRGGKRGGGVVCTQASSWPQLPRVSFSSGVHDHLE